MRPLKIKDRCTKKKIKKCEEVIRTYDKIQTAYAEILDKDEAIKSIQCILSMKESLIGKRKGVFGDELELVIIEITSERLVIQKCGVGKYKICEKCGVAINFYNNLLTIGRFTDIIYNKE